MTRGSQPRNTREKHIKRVERSSGEREVWHIAMIRVVTIRGQSSTKGETRGLTVVRLSHHDGELPSTSCSDITYFSQ